MSYPVEMNNWNLIVIVLVLLYPHPLFLPFSSLSFLISERDSNGVRNKMTQRGHHRIILPLLSSLDRML